MASIIPNFFIVGAPKAGTTSLYKYLSQHPEIFMSEIKETNYFSFDEIRAQGLFYNEENVKTIEQYNNLFSSVTYELAVGEASVSYLFYEKVPQKIFEYNASARIIMVLRDPVERGFSHYLMDKRMGLVKKPYEDIVRSAHHNKKDLLYYQQYVELGFYYEQVKRYLRIFGPEQVKIFFFEELKYDISQVVIDIYEFLGVESSFQPNLSRKYNSYKKPKNMLVKSLYQNRWLRKTIGKFAPGAFKDKLQNSLFKRADKPVLSNSLRNILIETYKNDIIQLEKLLDVHLSHWYNIS